MSGHRNACKTAKDVDGRRIVVGDHARAVDDTTGKVCGPAVRVVEIYRQGYDGTILRFDAAPETEYPHHFSRAASRCVRCAKVTEVDRLQERIARLELAAKPFVEFIDKFDANPLGGIADDFYSIHAGEDGASLRLSDLRSTSRGGGTCITQIVDAGTAVVRI